MSRFKPPTLEEWNEYIQANPELGNMEKISFAFYRGYADGGWKDTRGKPVRNWKLKLWTLSRIRAEYDPPKICYICKKKATKYRIEHGQKKYICDEHLPKEAPRRPPPKTKPPEMIKADKVQEQISKLSEGMNANK